MTETPKELDEIEAEAIAAVQRCGTYPIETQLGFALRRFLLRAFDLGARSGGVSERALIDARREGYVARFLERYPYDIADARNRAEERYPLPRVTRPLRVTLSDGSVWSYEPRRCDDASPFLVYDGEIGRTSLVVVGRHAKNAEDYRNIARMLSGETEEVEAEDCPPAPCSSRGTMNDITGMGLNRH